MNICLDSKALDLINHEEKKYWHQIRIEVNPNNFTYANNGKKFMVY